MLNERKGETVPPGNREASPKEKAGLTQSEAWGKDEGEPNHQSVRWHPYSI